MNYEGAGYVYAIRNTVNGGMYVGSTTAYKQRWGVHRSALRRGVHHSFILQKAWDKYGESDFEFKVLVVCPAENRIAYENMLMPLQRYNVLRTAKEQLVRGGWTHSEEFKARMSLLRKGQPLSDAHRAALAEAARRRVYGAEFSEKARARQLGVSPSKTTRGKLSEAVRVARGAERETNLRATRQMYEMAKSGTAMSEIFANAPISRGTFYKYCKELDLPALHRRKAQA